jgi:tRNA pseudouridine38-40 synthase
MKVMAILSYDGSRFNGFQKQNSGVKTVANKLYSALKSLNIDTTINASGRTDSGVHATNQVIDFIVPEYWKDLDKLKYFLNQKISPDIFIKDIKSVSDDFHSRYSAKRRVYRYIVSTEQFSVFSSPYVLYVKDIDILLVSKAIKYFIGIHDFEYFKKADGGSDSSVREIYDAKFYKHKNFYIFSFEANGYLRSQIRMMVQFLLDISCKKRLICELVKQLECKKRYSTDLVLPCGLYLSRIKY